MIFGIPQKVAFSDSNRILLRNRMLLGIIVLVTMLAAWFGGDLFIMRQVKAMAQTSKNGLLPVR